MITFLAIIGGISIVTILGLIGIGIFSMLKDCLIQIYIYHRDKIVNDLLEQKRKVNSLRYNHEVFTLSFSHLTPEMITDLNKQMAKILKTDVEKNLSRLEITIHEGKNRQVRKMCEAVGRKVIALHRSKIGNLGVKDLKLGTWRYMTKKEVEGILR